MTRPGRPCDARAVAHNPDLEARILSDLDDVAAYGVYGDWLTEQGDPRGELVAVQLRFAQTPDDPALRERERALLAAHAKTWLGELAGLDPKQDLAVTWRYGFVSSVRLGPPTEQYETSELDFPTTIARLFELPGIALLRELVVGAISYDDYPTSWSDCVHAIAGGPVPPGLARLEFNRGGYWDISSTELGDLSPAYPQLGRLRELSIELGSMELGAIELPELRTLQIVTGGLRSENLASLRTGHLPKLESLLLCLGDTGGDYGCTVELDDLGWIFAAEGIPGVRHLGLANSSLADSIAQALPASPVLRQLATLDLSRGTMSDEGLRAILDHVDAFAHLAKLDLSRGFFSPDLVAELKQKLPNAVVEDNQGPDEDYRYVEIGE